jgi:hypothetical protein
MHNRSLTLKDLLWREKCTATSTPDSNPANTGVADRPSSLPHETHPESLRSPPQAGEQGEGPAPLQTRVSPQGR